MPPDTNHVQNNKTTKQQNNTTTTQLHSVTGEKPDYIINIVRRDQMEAGGVYQIKQWNCG